ncbi:hypothetical protein VTH06DRAFT_2459 [Thermothelomyces fergusii]
MHDRHMTFWMGGTEYILLPVSSNCYYAEIARLSCANQESESSAHFTAYHKMWLVVFATEGPYPLANMANPTPSYR